ncbi:MAG: hypothetical protein Homavirus5_14 [Homavirus sp.]|uniref:Uncharacterized protein n=1 Tax=Homavirus sp. TaxID=2487769 RepID=A0A3G5A4P7_9VIRU|nr:MAG: hypothetical protein Homavirus5_14 [Homavirus sp.]
MTTGYKLVNPHIEGEFKSLFTEKSHFDAAQKSWEKLSSHFTNNIPLFAFTLERLKDNQLFHFTVKEDIKDNMVEYKITEIKPKLSVEEETQFKKTLKNMEGGRSRKHRYDDDDDDDSSSTTEIYKKAKYNSMIRKSQPITWWWYTPTPYKLDTFFVPTFAVPLTPYVEIQYANVIYPYKSF